MNSYKESVKNQIPLRVIVIYYFFTMVSLHDGDPFSFEERSPTPLEYLLAFDCECEYPPITTEKYTMGYTTRQTDPAPVTSFCGQCGTPSKKMTREDIIKGYREVKTAYEEATKDPSETETVLAYKIRKATKKHRVRQLAIWLRRTYELDGYQCTCTPEKIIKDCPSHSNRKSDWYFDRDDYAPDTWNFNWFYARAPALPWPEDVTRHPIQHRPAKCVQPSFDW